MDPQRLKTLSPELVADVSLYPTSEGGRKSAVLPGWGCPCLASDDAPLQGYDAWPLLGDSPLEPGEQRQLGFVFLSGQEAADELRRAGKFYLWEGRLVGEAVVVEDQEV